MTSLLRPRSVKVFDYDSVKLFESKEIGRGAYGKVCRAVCGQLPCAAKVLHQELFIYSNPDSKILWKFEQECETLSVVKHPCIVQYLATYRHPSTGQPVLLMELMDESLTTFLERSRNPIPLHIQINISHDITLALDYLHSNGVIHRDLTGNNVLLVAGCRAKVTDFGMLKMVDSQMDINPRLKTQTLCPGCPAYMPPEAKVTAHGMPQYTEKIDIFSFGVIVVQIITRLFPDPSDTARGSEIEKRRDHVTMIDMKHPLRQTVISCLKDRSDKRPKASELCRTLQQVKDSTQYLDSLHYDANEEVENLRLQLDVARRRRRELSDELQIAKAEVKRLRDSMKSNHYIQPMNNGVHPPPIIRVPSPQLPSRNGIHTSSSSPQSELTSTTNLRAPGPRLSRNEIFHSAPNLREPSPPIPMRYEVAEPSSDHRGSTQPTKPARPVSASHRRSKGSCSPPEVKSDWQSVKDYVDVSDEDDEEQAVPLKEEDKQKLAVSAPPSSSWYHGRINRDIASLRLQAVGKPGAYLVRNSESEPGLFVLSFLDRQLRVFNYKINYSNGMYNAMGQTEPSKRKWFSSLAQLIGYYSKYSTVKQNQHLDIPVEPPEIVPFPTRS